MAYFGKEFKCVKEENYDKLIATLEVAESKAKNFIQHKPNQKLVKNGDNDYTLTITAGDFKKALNFKPGVTFDDKLGEDLTAKSTFTVDGDVFTQVMDFGPKGSLTFKREFQADSLIVTLTASVWDGAAVRHYVVA